MLLFLELNEVNFDHLALYFEKGELPNLAALVKQHGVAETTSESRYEELEPWIQWVTAHTGLALDQHGVFRLGDIVNHDLPQIWETLESAGLKVGAISPMNANNACKNAAFFLPDPWTPARLTAGPVLRGLYSAVSQAVNDNAQSKITLGSFLKLIAGAAVYARPLNFAAYIRTARMARRKPWQRSMFLDLLLTDVFVKNVKRSRPDFASLFLNAAAHIQHHYMFNSAAYDGDLSNPEWYLQPGNDPVLDVYRLYDRIVGQVRDAFPEARLMLATGLHQVPHSDVTFYWRLKSHRSFLDKLEAPYDRVKARMSRDFVIYCSSPEDAKVTAAKLEACRALDGEPLFDVDNRGSDIFAMLVYPSDIGPEFAFTMGNQRIEGFRDDVAFVAIKNGQHNGTGYFVDSGSETAATPERFPLSEMPRYVCGALGVTWSQSMTRAAQ